MLRSWIVLSLAAASCIGPPLDAAEEARWRRELSEPSPEFSQMPFWFWNDDLENREIARQMAEFRRHGVYGFVIHARIGLPREVEYMGPRWLAHVRFAVEEAARTGMKVCLYDEGMYPSGSAHGAVVRSNPAFAAQGLAMHVTEATGPAELTLPAPARGKHVLTLAARPKGDRGVDLGGARLVRQPGKVRVSEGRWRVMTFVQEPTGGRIRGVHPGEDGGPGAPLAADLLNPDAMRAFLRFAYDPYYETLKDHFGTTALAMFTDEPSLSGRGGRPELQPWTQGLPEFFEARRGYPLLPVLPALFCDAGPRTRAIREDFHLTLTERLDETYYRPLSEWCQERGIALTGHPAGSDEIGPLRRFQIPGQDMVWRWLLPNSPTALEGPNSTVGKCSSSVARHDGRRRNANEIYGAYGWHLTMDEMKWLADWLMVRGVNLLYPHAFYYSIRDERVHERPPDLGMHNAWWPHYRLFADYTSRVCRLLADSRQECDVAVLSVHNRLPWRAAKWLFQNQIDFNYLEDWRLIEQAKLDGATLRVGGMAYRALIVDQDEPLTGPAAERAKALAAAGALVRYCRGAPSADLVAGLPRDVTLDPPSPELRYTHLVKHGLHFYLLVNEGERPIETTLTCRAAGKAEWFDPWHGRFRPAPILRAEPGISVPLRLERRESAVLCVDPSQPAVVTARLPRALSVATPIAGPWKVFDPQGRSLGDQLGDWRRIAGLERLAGTLRYETAFDAKKTPGTAYELHLGTVGDWAVVRLNGRDLGPRLWAPLVWDVTEAIRSGKNDLVVEVTNSWANRYAPKDARPSGLFGPVELRQTGGR
ncbi:MAG: glycosyl hydrolase [Thermoguttaceae bacterium]|jgi:hypothetical protein|nr:glycosyl hydrolase [Thermoguttaceae bacterium]